MQIANLMVELTDVRRQLAEAAAAAQPNTLHLAAMHCDPAVAKEFELLRGENSKLNQENSSLRSTIAALQYKPTDPVCS
jgi:hypothetical protein